MRRALLLAALLAGAWSSTAAAESPVSGHSLSCSLWGAPVYGGCYYEVPLFTVADALTFSLGLDAQLASAASGRSSYLAPFAQVTLQLESVSAWAQVAAPDSWGIPVIGKSPAWGVGFNIEFP